MLIQLTVLIPFLMQLHLHRKTVILFAYPVALHRSVQTALQIQTDLRAVLTHREGKSGIQPHPMEREPVYRNIILLIKQTGGIGYPFHITGTARLGNPTATE